ncbi:hypothetical protein CDD80_1953 [Ophiocordyceps camponoti-rufipedis]|uniref:Uncharacterized protein n=1 Tax=Ophiocordyceps camponoti-rufipedis TaxID=2004952 RepID=A0A2C5YCX7_9HYPO|nr:hypothetical protein CDD80_1953 [Ophiocordyceps camponoti-rufipedis]
MSTAGLGGDAAARGYSRDKYEYTSRHFLYLPPIIWAVAAALSMLSTLHASEPGKRPAGDFTAEKPTARIMVNPSPPTTPNPRHGAPITNSLPIPSLSILQDRLLSTEASSLAFRSARPPENDPPLPPARRFLPLRWLQQLSATDRSLPSVADQPRGSIADWPRPPPIASALRGRLPRLRDRTPLVTLVRLLLELQSRRPRILFRFLRGYGRSRSSRRAPRRPPASPLYPPSTVAPQATIPT